jgi:hypothetical protein
MEVRRCCRGYGGRRNKLKQQGKSDPAGVRDLGLLLDTLKGLGAECAEFSDLPDLTIFAVHFRYDDAGDDCGFPEREEVLENVAGLLAHVEQVLS